MKRLLPLLLFALNALTACAMPDAGDAASASASAPTASAPAASRAPQAAAAPTPAPAPQSNESPSRTKPAPPMSKPLPPDVAPTPEPAPAKTGAILTNCRTNADCAVKNVGSCCGAQPACVNVNSPTNPDAVRAACAREGRASACGFRPIAGCQCTRGQCEPDGTLELTN